MTDAAVSLIAHPIGFITGAILYAMILVLALQTPGKSVSRNVKGTRVAPLRRLSLWTAILGLLWNAGELAAFLLPSAAPAWVNHALQVTALSALGFLPAVVVHSFLQSGMRQRAKWTRRVLLTGAYALSAGAGAFNVLVVLPVTTLLAVEAMSLLAMGFVLLLALVLADTVRRQGWDHHAGVVTLAVIAAAAMPFSRHQSGEYAWWVELIGHHASLPLALAILYEDFRFAFGDIFLKRALSLIGLVGVAMGLYVGLGASQFVPRVEQPGSGLVMSGTLIGLWVATALLYPYLSRGVSWLVDKVVLRRANYEKFLYDVAQEIMGKETPEDVLDQCCAMLKSVLSTEDVEWSSIGPQERKIDGLPYRSLVSSRNPVVTRDAPDVIVDIPTVDPTRYFIRIGPLPHGRRLLSDDLYHLESLAHLLSRRITTVQVTHERCAQALREQEIHKLATESELRALRAQLHPHFLFNALTTIGYLIRASPTRAVETLMRLSDLLRSVLEQVNKEFTTIGHEMDLVRAYLDIERARFEDRLTFHFDIPESMRAVPIPALIVQPLVENAVKHGIEPSTSRGKVRVAAWINASDDHSEPRRHPRSMLHVQVWNTGGGAAPLRNGNDQGIGLGLSNIRQRLSLHYNERATVDMESSPEHGTVVNVVIPLDDHEVVIPSSPPDGQREQLTVGP